MRALAFDDTVAREPLRSESPPARPTTLPLPVGEESLLRDQQHVLRQHPNPIAVHRESASKKPLLAAMPSEMQVKYFCVLNEQEGIQKPLAVQQQSLADDEVFFDITPGRPTFSLGVAEQGVIGKAATAADSVQLRGNVSDTNQLRVLDADGRQTWADGIEV